MERVNRSLNTGLRAWRTWREFSVQGSQLVPCHRSRSQPWSHVTNANICWILRLRIHVWLFITPWIVVHQAPMSMGFSRQGYWSGLLFPSPRDLPNPSQGSNLGLLQCRWILCHLSHQGSQDIYRLYNVITTLWKKSTYHLHFINEKMAAVGISFIHLCVSSIFSPL